MRIIVRLVAVVVFARSSAYTASTTFSKEETYRSHGTEFVGKRVGSDGRRSASFLDRGKGGGRSNDGGEDHRLHGGIYIS